MNPNKKEYKRMTAEQLKAHKGLEGISTERAEDIIESLEKFSILMFNLYKKVKEDEQNGGLTIAEFCKRKIG